MNLPINNIAELVANTKRSQPPMNGMDNPTRDHFLPMKLKAKAAKKTIKNLRKLNS